MAMPWERSLSRRWVTTPRSTSELVRTKSPTRSERRGKPRRLALSSSRSGHGAEHASGEDDVPGPVGLSSRSSAASGGGPVAGLDLVAALHGPDPGDLRVGLDAQPPPLGQVEVVLVQGVLRAVVAARACSRRTTCSRCVRGPRPRRRGPGRSPPASRSRPPRRSARSRRPGRSPCRPRGSPRPGRSGWDSGWPRASGAPSGSGAPAPPSSPRGAPRRRPRRRDPSGRAGCWRRRATRRRRPTPERAVTWPRKVILKRPRQPTWGSQKNFFRFQLVLGKSPVRSLRPFSRTRTL